MSQLARVEPKSSIPSLDVSENDLIHVLENSVYPGAARESIMVAIDYCRAAKLDPLQKPVHIVPMWDDRLKRMRDVIMPGINLYRIQADRSGCYAGVSEPEFGPDVEENLGGVKITYPAWCKVTVKRRLATGEIAEFSAKEMWKENYATKSKDSLAPNKMWGRRPYAQLVKCAESQALRKAFPEISAQPAATETVTVPIEVVDPETGEIVTIHSVRGPEQVAAKATVVEQQILPEYPAESFAENLPKWRDLIESGRKNADAIIASVQRHATLSAEQIENIKALVDQDFEEIPAEQVA
jgi:phage recombination protein Bet